MSLPSIFYNTRHENNLVSVSARKGFTFYTDLGNLPNPQIQGRPRVFIVCELFHRVISTNPSHQGQRILHEEHVLLSQLCSEIGNFATAEKSRSSIEYVLSQTPLPFDLDGNGDRLRWKDRVRMSFNETTTVGLSGSADVANRVSEVAERIAGEVMSSVRPVTSVEMKISFSKVTYVEAEAFREINENDNYISFSDDNGLLILRNDLSGLEWGSMNYDIYDDDVAVVDDYNNKINVVYETVEYDGDATELTCEICTDDVVVGAHLAKLACGHMLHSDCIDPWLKKKTTCPICRFDLAK